MTDNFDTLTAERNENGYIVPLKNIIKNTRHLGRVSRPAQEAGIFVHNKIHSVEKDNSGVEGAHKSEELAERGAKYGARKVKEGYRSHKLKPYRAAAKAEKW